MPLAHSVRLRAVAFALLLFGIPSVSHAQSTYYWDTTSGTWSTAANWSLNPTSGGGGAGVPGSSDNVVFNQSSVTGSTSVQFNQDQSIAGMTFANGSGAILQGDGVTPRTLTLGSNGITIITGAGAVTLGDINNVNILNLSLSASQTWTNNSSAMFTVYSGISLANSGPQTLILAGSGATTLSGLLANGAGTLSLTQAGSGTLTLNGSQGNTYTGITTITGGGTLAENLANLSTPTNLISSSSALVIGNGTLSVTGKSTGTSSQAFNGTTLNSGVDSVAITSNGGTSTTVNFGAITQNVGAILDLTTVTSTNSASVIPKASSINGVTPSSTSYFGAWAVYGTGIATRFVQINSNSQIVVGINGTPLTAGTAGNMTISTTVYTAAGTYSPTGNLSGYGLLLNGATTFNLGTATLTLNGMIQTQAAVSAFIATTGGGIVIGSENNLVIHMTSGTTGQNVTISAPIMNNTSSGIAGNLTIGTSPIALGAVILSATPSTYTGITTVNAATLTLGLANVLNSASSIVVNGGTLGYSTFNQSVSGVKITGGTITGSTGTLTSATNYDIEGGTISGILAGTGIAAIVSTTGTATLSAANTFTGGVTLNAGTLLIFNDSGPTYNALGTGTLTINGGVLSSSASPNAGATAKIPNAVVIAGSVNFGTASLTSNRAFTITGGTTISNNPTITLANITATGSVGSVYTFSTNPMTLNSGATFIVNEPLTISGGFTSTASQTLTFTAPTTNAITLSGPLSLGSSSNALTLAGSGTPITINGLTNTGSVTGGLTISGVAATSASSNTYNGTTTITSGSLALTGTGSISTNSTSIVLGAAGTFDVTGLTATSYTMSASQTFTFTIDPTGSGSAGLLNANATGKTLVITNGHVNFSTLGTLDDQAYVLVEYNALTGSAFASITNLPAGYVLNYNYLSSNEIALVSTTPEPYSAGLIAALVMGGGVIVRRQRR